MNLLGRHSSCHIRLTILRDLWFCQNENLKILVMAWHFHISQKEEIKYFYDKPKDNVSFNGKILWSIRTVLLHVRYLRTYFTDYKIGLYVTYNMEISFVNNCTENQEKWNKRKHLRQVEILKHLNIYTSGAASF